MPPDAVAIDANTAVVEVGSGLFGLRHHLELRGGSALG